MSWGLVELVLVFGAVLVLAVVELIAIKRDLAAKPPEPLESKAEPRATREPSKTRSRKPRASGT